MEILESLDFLVHFVLALEQVKKILLPYAAGSQDSSQGILTPWCIGTSKFFFVNQSPPHVFIPSVGFHKHCTVAKILIFGRETGFPTLTLQRW
jgi:hypothetical protein